MSASEPTSTKTSDSAQVQQGKLRWLHLSDIHFWRKNDWRDDAARRKLLTLLREKFADASLPKPDLIFCTGDIAQGETKPDEMAEQYKSAQRFFDEVLQVCGLQKERLFVVPGNHDVNRTKVSEFTQAGLRSFNHSKVASSWALKDVGFDEAIKRLNEYGAFVQAYLPHQAQTEDEKTRHCYSKLLAINGVRVGIAGFNSAWTCFDDTDQNQLWMAAEWQFSTADGVFDGKSDLRIGLIHHPVSWLRTEEVSLSNRRIRSGFHFWLHGHEHEAWITPTDCETMIAAGAVNAKTDDEFGINFVDLDVKNGKGQIHLFAYNTGDNAWQIKPELKAPLGVREITCMKLEFASQAPTFVENAPDPDLPSDPERITQTYAAILALLHKDHFDGIPNLKFAGDGMPQVIGDAFDRGEGQQERKVLCEEVLHATLNFAREFVAAFERLPSASPLQLDRSKHQFWKRIVNAMQMAILLIAKQNTSPKHRINQAYNAENPCEIEGMSWLSVCILMRDDLAACLRSNSTQLGPVVDQLADNHALELNEVELGTGEEAKIHLYKLLKYLLDGGRFPDKPTQREIEELQGKLRLRKRDGKHILVFNQHTGRFGKELVQWLNTAMSVGHVTIMGRNGEFDLPEGYWRAYLEELMIVLRAFEPPMSNTSTPNRIQA